MKPLLNSLIFLIALATAVSAKEPLLDVPWGGDFSLRRSESGDTFSIGAVFGDGKTVYIYNLAAGRVVSFDTNGTRIKSTAIQSIGRTTYVGDDFVIYQGRFVFVNSIDKRLELFDTANGDHVGSIKFPPDLLAGELKRSWRIVNRIFVDYGTVYLGNEHVVAPLEGSLGKRKASASNLYVTGAERIALIANGQRVLTKGAVIKGSCLSCTVPNTHYPISGKRFVIAGNHTLVLVLSKTGVSLVTVK